MKYSSLYLLLIFLTLWGCASVEKIKKDEQNTYREEILKKQKDQEAQIYIDSRKSNNNLYWGESIYKINNDLGLAIKSAEKGALSDLSQKIKVVVVSDITKIVISDLNMGQENNDEKIKKTFREKINLYSSTELYDIKEKYFIDYPAQGYITFFVEIAKDQYLQKVTEDLERKKSQVITALKSGNAEYEMGNYMVAVNNWIRAKQLLSNYFGTLPLGDDVDDDGRPEEINAYLESRIFNLFGNIKFSFIGSNITYNAKGTISQKPLIYAQYTDASGQTRPVFNLPLKVDFISGRGEIIGDIKTSSYGQAEIPLTVDATMLSNIIIIGIDKDRVSGLEQFKLSILPDIQLTLDKIKTVALSVSFYNQSKRSTPEELKSEINSLLLNKGFLTIEFSISGNQVQPNDLFRAVSTNADYLFVINLNTTTARSIGDYQNMWTSSVSGIISLYKLPIRDQLATENIRSAKGYGTSADVAGWDAYSRIKDKVINKSNIIIEKIQ